MFDRIMLHPKTSAIGATRLVAILLGAAGTYHTGAWWPVLAGAFVGELATFVGHLREED